MNGNSDYQDDRASPSPIIRKPGEFPGEGVELVSVFGEYGGFIGTFAVRIVRLDAGFAVRAGLKDVDEGRLKGYGVL